MKEMSAFQIQIAFSKWLDDYMGDFDRPLDRTTHNLLWAAFRAGLKKAEEFHGAST